MEKKFNNKKWKRIHKLLDVAQFTLLGGMIYLLILMQSVEVNNWDIALLTFLNIMFCIIRNQIHIGENRMRIKILENKK